MMNWIGGWLGCRRLPVAMGVVVMAGLMMGNAAAADAGRGEAARNAAENAAARSEAAGNAVRERLRPDEIVYVDGESFRSMEKFHALWGYSYPWGPDHNGSARMMDRQVTVRDAVLTLEADRLTAPEGKSSLSPFLPIHYHSGAVHLKQIITVSDSLPGWTISGEFQAPVAPGSWPAFWVTGVDNWPPESDIMELKGDDTVWQNTITGPDYRNVHWATSKTAVHGADTGWHSYKAVLDRIDAVRLRISYFVDGRLVADHEANFMNKRFWLIINLQMEGSSGDNGPKGRTVLRAKNIFVAARPAVGVLPG